MTDEEMAKQFADGYATPDVEPTLRMHLYECSKESFLAGLITGRPQWHKVADGDLPSCNDLVLFKTDVNYYIGKIDHSKKLWWTGFCLDDSISNSFVIAWCEIPKYTEETDK